MRANDPVALSVSERARQPARQARNRRVRVRTLRSKQGSEKNMRAKWGILAILRFLITGCRGHPCRRSMKPTAGFISIKFFELCTDDDRTPRPYNGSGPIFPA